VSDTFYVNLFHNGFIKYSGFKKSLENSDREGVRPVMMPIKQGLKGLFSFNAVRFPYRLDKEKNIRKISVNDYEIAFLIPSRDVPNLTGNQFEDSIYFRLFGDNEGRIQELRDKVEGLEKDKGKLRKEIRELKEEEEEQNKGGSGSTRNSLQCSCGASNPRSRWESNNGLCPSCGQVYVDDEKVRSV
jgi:hypothetical protein